MFPSHDRCEMLVRKIVRREKTESPNICTLSSANPPPTPVHESKPGENQNLGGEIADILRNLSQHISLSPFARNIVGHR